MEDFQLDIVLGKGPSARTIRLDLPRFTLVGATTRTGLITGPLRDRFGFVARLDYYSPGDLDAIIRRSAAILERAPRCQRGGRRSPGGPGERLASPTACSSGCGTSPRSAATGLSTSGWPAGVWSCSGSTSWAWTRWTGPSWTPSAPASGVVPSVCRRWRSASGRRPTRWRTSTSRTCCSSGCSCARPEGRVATPAAWQHLGLEAPPAPAGGPDGSPGLF